MRLDKHSAVIVLAAMSLAAPASAAVSKEQGKCQAGAAKAVVAFFAAETKALAACNDAVGDGDLPLGTDCRSAAADALANAQEKFTAAVASSCTDVAVNSLRYAGACADAADAAAVTSCLLATQQGQADAFVSLLYADDALPSATSFECRQTASRDGRKFAQKALGALHKCKNLASKGKIAARARCEDDARYLAAVGKLYAKLESSLVSACDAGAIAGAALGRCASAATGQQLAQCLRDGVEQMQSSLTTAEYGDGGLCGDAHNAVEGRAASLIAEMSVSEKARLMAGAAYNPPLGTITNSVDRLEIPAFALLDGPRGVSKMAGNATAFPVAMARGASWDVDLERRIGSAIGVETRAKGASVLLAPVTTIVRHPRWGRAQETYGEDPVLLGAMGAAFVEGAQQHVMTSLKHYAVNSIEDTRHTVDVTVDERTLREIYLPHFRQVVTQAKTASVMSAYNSVNGFYCDENVHLLTDILKGEWGFDGFVISDWVNGTHSTVGSALAGLDIEMPFPQYFTRAALVDAVENGDLDESVLDESTRRKLRKMFCFGVDSDPPQMDPSAIETAEHLALAREAAEKGTVLLKNDGAALPLPAAGATIAILGPIADIENIGDQGSSDVTPSSSITVLEGITARIGAGSVVHVQGDPNESGNAAAIAAADAVVVVAGFTSDDEGESFVGAGDRDTYDLPAAQQQLILDAAALNLRTVVVLEGGSSIGVDGWIDAVEGLVMAWYPGMQGGEAIARVLFGDVNPSGKMPLTLAKTDADLPPFLNDQNAVTYDYYHGYRLLDRDAKDPRFPFGFGLSYTTYAYSNLVLEDDSLGEEDTLHVTFDVTNSGGVAGEEVVQLYVAHPVSMIDRPVRDLRAFTRVALAAGETKAVTLSVPVANLAWYDTLLPGWSIEHTTYEVQVGSSSRDLSLVESFSVGP